MARHRSREEWSRIVAAYPNRSGSRAEFCEAHEISGSSLDYHRRKSRQNQSEAKQAPRIVELPTSLPVESQYYRNTELCFQHSELGEVTIRCHHRDLSEVIIELSDYP